MFYFKQIAAKLCARSEHFIIVAHIHNAGNARRRRRQQMVTYLKQLVYLRPNGRNNKNRHDMIHITSAEGV